jgi:hypothetical protein
MGRRPHIPIALLLTPGEPHDSTAFSDLIEDHDADPDAMLADRPMTAPPFAMKFARVAASQKSPPRRADLSSTRSIKSSMPHASSFLGFAKLTSIRLRIRFGYAA